MAEPNRGATNTRVHRPESWRCVRGDTGDISPASASRRYRYLPSTSPAFPPLHPPSTNCPLFPKLSAPWPQPIDRLLAIDWRNIPSCLGAPLPIKRTAHLPPGPQRPALMSRRSCSHCASRGQAGRDQRGMRGSMPPVWDV